jgi:hypothetical protein
VDAVDDPELESAGGHDAGGEGVDEGGAVGVVEGVQFVLWVDNEKR